MTSAKTPTLQEYFSSLVDEKYRTLRKASLEEAFAAAETDFQKKHGFKQDFSFEAYKKRRYRSK